MSSCEELLQSIHPGMKPAHALFLKIYGFEISFQGFSDTAIKVLERTGCSKARQYYDSIVGEYENEYQQQVKEVGEWYLKECEKKWQNRQMGGEEKRKWRIMQDLHQKSDRELLSLLQTLN